MTFSFPLGLFLGCMLGMLLGRHMVHRALLRGQNPILPGQWFDIPRAGPFHIAKIDGSYVRGTYFGDSHDVDIPIETIRLHAKPCPIPLTPMPGSRWTVPHMGQVYVIGCERDQVSYSRHDGSSRYDSPKMSLAQFTREAEPLLQIESTTSRKKLEATDVF